jgi:hypothetical protein
VADENTANALTHAVGSAGKTDRRRILQAALAAGPVILTLKAGPARAVEHLNKSVMASMTHASHGGGTGFSSTEFTTSSIDSPTSGGYTTGGTGGSSGGSTTGGSSGGYTTGGAAQTSAVDESGDTCTTTTTRRWRLVRTADGGGRDGDGINFTRQWYDVTKTVCDGTNTAGNRYRRRLRWARLHSMMGGDRMGDGGQ